MEVSGVSYALFLLLASAVVSDRVMDSELEEEFTDGQVTLIGGANDSEGNVLVYHLSQWGLICDDVWNIWAGLVVCRQLGYYGVEKVTRKGVFPRHAHEKIWMDNVECKGDEKNISECRFHGWGRHNCDPKEAAGVVCRTEPKTTAAPSTEMPLQNDASWRRAVKYKILGLVGGKKHPDDGYVQVEVDGRKGTICADHWTLKEAEIVCRQLGKHHAAQFYKELLFGGGDQPKILAGIMCEGHEKTLGDCLHRQVLDEVGCPSKELVAGVSCTEHLPDLIPDVAELERTLYLQDQPLYYLSCAMEEGCAARSAYTIKETSGNWHLHLRRLLRFSSNVFNNGTADFRPNIPKHRWEWHNCHRHYHSMEVFATYDVVDSLGNRVAEGHKASFCLEDSGGCVEGKQRRYNCENYGDQGISVGCSDMYKHDIDCQWIDVTDVAPGVYTLKIQVNPENKVAELNYDNNLVTCHLYYMRTYAKVRKCKVVRPDS